MINIMTMSHKKNKLSDYKIPVKYPVDNCVVMETNDIL